MKKFALIGFGVIGKAVVTMFNSKVDLLNNNAF